jgi:short-subunit dehydrogenase
VKRNLSGKHIWLIGASTGIGRELAMELARRGARLTVSARSVEQLNSLKEEIGDTVSVLPLDVSDQPAIAHAGETIEDLDGVVFLAAAYNPDKLKELIPPDRINQVVTVNLTGAMHVTQAVRRKLSGREDSFLALYASIAGYRGLPRGQPYSATKAGLINYAESLRTELRGKVDVKVINSGFVDTRITRQNDFRMPVLMKPEQAAIRIANGLERGGFEICFPKRFAYVVKLLRLLPNSIFFAISRKMV